MLCPNCHAYVPSDAVRCPRCGMPVNLPDDGEKQEDSDLLAFRQGRHLAAHQQASMARMSRSMTAKSLTPAMRRRRRLPTESVPRAYTRKARSVPQSICSEARTGWLCWSAQLWR